MNLGFLDLDRERFWDLRDFLWNRDRLLAPFAGLHLNLDPKTGPLSSWKLVNG